MWGAPGLRPSIPSPSPFSRLRFSFFAFYLVNACHCSLLSLKLYSSVCRLFTPHRLPYCAHTPAAVRLEDAAPEGRCGCLTEGALEGQGGLGVPMGASFRPRRPSSLPPIRLTTNEVPTTLQLQKPAV